MADIAAPTTLRPLVDFQPDAAQMTRAGERVADAALAVGDVVRVSTNGVAKAQADSAANATGVLGIAVKACPAGQPPALCYGGLLTGFSGLTPQTRYVLSAAAAGAIAPAADLGTGDEFVEVGIAVSATELFVRIYHNSEAVPA